jgi:putative redox protein
MEHYVSTKWAGAMAFNSHIDKHVVRIDGEHTPETDTGPGPKSLLLTALTGCTGMDVVSILNKMRIQYDSLEVEAIAPLTEEHPKVYTKIHMIYKVSGSALNAERVNHAVELSMDKYCGVTAMLRAHCPITHEVVLIDSQLWKG